MRPKKEKCKKRRCPWVHKRSDKATRKRAMVARQVGLPDREDAWDETDAERVRWLEARMAVHRARQAWNASTPGDDHNSKLVDLKAAEKMEAEYATQFKKRPLGDERASEERALENKKWASNTQLQTCPPGVKPARDKAALAKGTQAIAKDDTAHTASSRSHDHEDSPNSQTITAGTSSTRCRDLFVAHDKLRIELSSELASLRSDIKKMRCKALDAMHRVDKHVPSAGLLELQRTSNLTIANTDELWKNICAKADEISLVQNQIMSDVNDLTRDVVDVATHQL